MFQLPFDPPATQHFVFALSPRAKLKLARGGRKKGSVYQQREGGERARAGVQSRQRARRATEREGEGSGHLSWPHDATSETEGVCIHGSLLAPHLCFAISASIPRV